jgi:hypothetical protein
VVPIVLHTGKTPWRKNRKLADLIGGPESFRKFAPSWRPIFLDLAGKTPAELLQAAGEWLNALAVVRADQEGTEEFRAILETAMRRLDGLAEKDIGRWYDLVHFVVLWALYRRPREERDRLVEIAQASQSNVARQKEIQTVSQTIAESLIAEGEVKGRLGEVREMLVGLLEDKFGALPESVLQRIGATTDLARLKTATRRVSHLASLEELQLGD